MTEREIQNKNKKIKNRKRSREKKKNELNKVKDPYNRYTYDGSD